jgi:(2S)-methylsuccinyl-CoA dehydrogenase
VNAEPAIASGDSFALDLVVRVEAWVEHGFAHLQRLTRRTAAAIGPADAPRSGMLEPAALDAQQIPSYDLALCAAELAAARAVLEYARRAEAGGATCSPAATAGEGYGADDSLARPLAEAFALEAVSSVLARLTVRAQDLGLDAARLGRCWPSLQPALARACKAEALSSLGAALLARDGRLPPSLLDPHTELMRDTFAKFGADVVSPRAAAIHRDDADIPEEIVAGASELGVFGVSIPERYGGLQPDDRPDTLAMLVVTEALSACSLGAAGSLITRPEIMARALLAGGTEAQKTRWLPKLASGENLVAISITEPDFGSDVAGLKLKATRLPGRGWALSGSKTWCTFAGRADVIVVIARTNPDPALGHRGLSMFLVEKPRFAGHEFEFTSPLGGRIGARAIPTIGYRGMHSFDVFYEDFVVADDALVGGTAGEGRGFYLTMTGMSGGRVQTSARANGVMQAAYDAAVRYAQSRRVFGQPIGAYPLMQGRIARMAAWLMASRQLSYAVARRLDAGGGEMEASLVKLFACRAAEWVTRDAMQMHGGMGYAEETDASRYFVDARVLSIFEGAEETLALKVIARERIARASSLQPGEPAA